MLGEKGGDAGDAGRFEPVPDVEEDDAAEEVRPGGGDRDSHDPAHRSSDEHGPVDPELDAERADVGGQSVPVERGALPRAGEKRVGVAVVGEVPGEHVVPPGQGRSELLEHVGGLAATVETDDRREPGVAPLQVVDLAIPETHEAAPAAVRHVVAGGQILGGLTDHLREPNGMTEGRPP